MVRNNLERLAVTPDACRAGRMGALVVRNPDTPSSRPIRRLARLNEGKWDPDIPAATEVEQGVFGHVLDRAPGVRFTTIYFDHDGNQYEEHDTTTVGRTDKKESWLLNHPILVGAGDDIAAYSETVLARFDLPRPEKPGMYWEDDASGGLLRWGPEAPPDLLDRIPFVGLYEPMADKFVEENIDRWPDCWEAPLASAYLDLWGQISGELERVHARFEDAVHDRNVSPLSVARRRSNRDPLDFPDWAFDSGYYFGRLIGELTERWRLGLLHGPSLLHDHRRRDAASAAVQAATGQRRSASAAWKREAVRLAGEVSAALTIPAAAKAVLRRAARLSRTVGATGLDGAAGENRRAALEHLAGLKADTVERALRENRLARAGSSQAETPDNRSS